MILYYILDDKGEPEPCADVLTWVERMEGRGRQIAETQIGATYVSTVFLGIDHSFGGGTPVLWETMAFWRGYRGDLLQWRYTSRDKALSGHERVVRLVRAALPKDLAYTAAKGRYGRYWQRRATSLRQRGARHWQPGVSDDDAAEWGWQFEALANGR